jgi:L-alanine-DL-glutamate epimerase-like enolase superfamily enzyme
MELSVSAYTVPTDAPESDGTFEWDATTVVVVECAGGLGWTYAPAAAGGLIEQLLAPALRALDPLDVPGAWAAMVAAVRNAGPWGLAMYAVSAVDVALWDAKARALGVSLVSLLGRVRERVPVYGSGGFCSYDDARLREQLGGWVAEGIPRVKMKVGRGRDVERVAAARDAIGAAELMVDANGAWDAATALRMAEAFAASDVRWLEEPVSSDDPDGLRLLRSRVPAGMAVAAGEYATSAFAFGALLGSVDVLQADVTRCGGITGFLKADALCAAHATPLSAHCAPALSAHVMAAARGGLHIEYFHDHVRLERMLFDGLPELHDGALVPDASRPGHGIALKHADARRFAV